MKNPLEDRWKVLKNVEPTEFQKSMISKRILSSLRNRPAPKRQIINIHLKYVMLTCLFLFLSAGALYQLQVNHSKNGSSVLEPGTALDFTWDLEKVTSKKNGSQRAFYKEGSSVLVGYAEDITNSKTEELLKNKPIQTEKELENFPYPTTLYIEHVKMHDTALRYHFIVTAGEHITHFSFDYPKLSHAEIFQLAASLSYKSQAPYLHPEQLYVTYGYDTLPYPVGLEPIKKFMQNTERYLWEKGSKTEFKNYLNKIRTSGEWIEKQGGGDSYTFASSTGYVVVKISFVNNELVYEYSYPEQEG
jgi:hypothetical protein